MAGSHSMPMLSTWMKLWGSLTTFVKTKRKHHWSRSFRTVHVRVAGNYLESTSSFPEVEMAISLHTFRLSYMDMIEILLGLIRASREGDWMLRLPWHMTDWTMHDISHTTTPRCLSCTPPTQMCTLNSCKEGFQFSLTPTTPSEESLSIKGSKKRRTRTHRRQGDQGVQFGTMDCEQILIDRRV